MSVQINIDGRSLSVEKGTTILQAARQNDIYIPTLCDFPGLPSRGSCRMCIVEIQGKANTPTACTTPVESGMVVQTISPKVQALRGELLQMLLAEHPSSCLFCPEKSHCDECMVTLRKAGVTTGCRSCPKDEQCALQEMVERLGISQMDYPVRYRMLPAEKFDPFFERDYNLCILCGRCIRTCDELHFTNILAYTQRGTSAVVGTAFNRTHLEAGCTFCGSCVEVCPVGALTEKTRKWDGKPETETSSTCPLCSIGCQLKLLSKKDTLIGSLPDPSAGNPVLCVKGRFGFTELVNHPTRLKQPHKRVGSRQSGTTWEEAIRIAAEKLSACSPERFELIVSADLSNEDLFVAQKFARQVMKVDGIHAPLLDRYGQGMPWVAALLRQSQPLAILQDTATILCLGVDTQYAQSVVEVELHKTKTRCARLISVYPKPNSLGKAADEWLQPLPGEESKMVHALAGLAAHPSTAKPANVLERAANWLYADPSPVIIVGPDFLTHPDNHHLLPEVAALVEQTSARLIVLPEQGNLAGCLSIGALPVSSTAVHSDLDVLFMIGESIPQTLPGDPFILWQNIYPPAGSHAPDLILPAAAFSEIDSTTLDYAGRLKTFHQAVPAPGDALPSWQILCQIARVMGVSGFEYANAAQIQAEIAANDPAINENVRAKAWEDPETALLKITVNQIDQAVSAHRYMGFPLTQFVAGFKMLVPTEQSKFYQNVDPEGL